MGLDLRFCFSPFIKKKIQLNICGNVVLEDKMEFQNGTELKYALSLKLLKEQALLLVSEFWTATAFTQPYLPFPIRIWFYWSTISFPI